MTDIITESMGREYPLGFYRDYWTCRPETLILKIQGDLVGNELTLMVIVNVKQSGELKFSDVATLAEGDRIFAEPDGLTILTSGATTDQIERINGQLVQVGSFFEGTFLAHPTVEP
jgi:hypothetical protein